MREMIAPTLPWAPLLRLLDTSTGIPALKGPNIESNTQASDSYPIPPPESLPTSQAQAKLQRGCQQGTKADDSGHCSEVVPPVPLEGLVRDGREEGNGGRICLALQ